MLCVDRGNCDSVTVEEEGVIVMVDTTARTGT